MSHDQRTEALALAALKRKIYAEWDPQRLKYIVCSGDYDSGLYAAVQANGNKAFCGETAEIALAAAAEAMGLLRSTTDRRDRNLPKSFEHMNMADMLAHMERSENSLFEWLDKQQGAVATIQVEEVRQLLQSIIWGRELTEQVLLMKVADDSTPTYDQDEATWFIRQRTDLPEEIIRAVLNADEAYMEDKGILTPADDQDEIETVGPVQ